MMFLKTLPIALVLGVLLFTSAGRIDIPQFWLYVSLLWLSAGAIYTIASHRHPDLVAERMRPPSDRDRITRRIALPLMIAHCVIAGLDVGRFGWSQLSIFFPLTGLALVAGGMYFTGWTLISNPYASSAVRIQKERNQHVITSGPYSIVRHPMYLGVFLFSLGSGLALGSWTAAVMLLPLIVIFIRRTLIEDKMLHAELSGYTEYATKVRWRVVPGLF